MRPMAWVISRAFKIGPSASVSSALMARPHLPGIGLLALLLVISSTYAAVWTDSPFDQLQVRRWLINRPSAVADWGRLQLSGEVLQIATGPGTLTTSYWILTTAKLYSFDPDTSSLTEIQLGSVTGTVTQMTVSDSDPNTLILAGRNQIVACKVQSSPNSNLQCSSVPISDNGAIKALAYLPNGDIYIASDKLYRMRAGSNSLEKILDAARYSSIAYSHETDTLAVGTDRLLWVYGKWGSATSPIWRFFRVDGLIDSAITSLTFTEDGVLYIGNELALNAMNPDLTFVRYGGGPNGIPYGNISSVAASSSGSIWLGTARGVIRFNEESKNFRYFNGPRYMTDEAFGPGNAVKDVATGSWKGKECALMLTGTGLSLFHFESMTLADKAARFQQQVYPYHDRFGLTASCSLRKFGDLSSYELRDSENDGLWTSMYLASQALRYAVTQDPDAKANANKALSALELLNNVTGVTGLFARSVLFQNQLPGGHLPWYQSKTMPGWVWQGDTSSDEVTGHIFAYTLYYRFVASTDAEKDLSSRLITNCLTYIVQNDLYLIDVSGNRTTWGVWNPKYINDNPDWFDQRGLNSVQIMAWLSAAREIAAKSGRPTVIYDAAIRNLKSAYQYDLNIINAKIAIPTDDNYSDDELQHLPMYTYIASNGRELDETFYTCCDRTFQIVKKVHSPLWNFIYAASLQSRPSTSTFPDSLPDVDLQNSITTMQQWPMSWVNWPIDNTQRLDTVVSQYVNRHGRSDLVDLLPYDEIAFYRWNTDPFELRTSDSGFSVTDPTAFLLPYWMGRYHGLITAPISS